eukprot:1087343-Amphidinium_carterae.1
MLLNHTLRADSILCFLVVVDFLRTLRQATQIRALEGPVMDWSSRFSTLQEDVQELARRFAGQALDEELCHVKVKGSIPK